MIALLTLLCCGYMPHFAPLFKQKHDLPTKMVSFHSYGAMPPKRCIGASRIFAERPDLPSLARCEAQCLCQHAPNRGFPKLVVPQMDGL